MGIGRVGSHLPFIKTRHGATPMTDRDKTMNSSFRNFALAGALAGVLTAALTGAASARDAYPATFYNDPGWVVGGGVASPLAAPAGRTPLTAFEGTAGQELGGNVDPGFNQGTRTAVPGVRDAAPRTSPFSGTAGQELGGNVDPGFNQGEPGRG